MYQKLFKLQEDTLKVVANQKRLEIIQLLNNRELPVNEMVEMLGIRQANLSQHLSLLREAKIVTTRRVGVTIYYSLTDLKVAQACSLIKEFLREHNSADPEVAEILSRDGNGLYPVVKDVVCKMRISVSEAPGTLERNNITYYFCGAGCLEQFVAAPVKYEIKETVHG
jgi:DNA-binding transcriptional ArsR family regulator/YHS domain-containing protein